MAQTHSNGGYTLNEFLGKKPHCDVVMKGGITSGVVYPLAVVELAKKFRLKNIGGASAGAIAAGFAAAAEFGRETGGFLRLAEVAEEVSEKLPKLFQPTQKAAPVFYASLNAIELPTKFARAKGVILAVAGGWRLLLFWSALPPALVAAIFVVLGFQASLSATGWVLIGLLCLIAFVVSFAVTLVWRVVSSARMLLGELEQHGFGLCPGTRQSSEDHDALSEWLHARINYVAGLDADAPPLTFGQLQGSDPQHPEINLEVMTTNLAAGCPYRIPFRDRGLYFRKHELSKVLSQAVVDWMAKHAEPYEHDQTLLELPPTADLPVVFAVRLSLSFPVLLSAVPLYARDFLQLDKEKRNVPRRCWFSDGGICSNFPIHFFDNVLPRCPTFGITLEPFLTTHHKKSVWLPPDARSGIQRPLVGEFSLFSFLGSIVSTAKGWRDTMQSSLPGYRERIVHVYLKSDEGGLNLNMPAERINKLMSYGRLAGETLRDEFNWDEHRWKRFLVWVAELEEIFERLRVSYLDAPVGDVSNADFLSKYRHHPTCYAANGGEWFDAADANVRGLLACFDQWIARKPAMRRGEIPKPEVDTRLTPRI